MSPRMFFSIISLFSATQSPYLRTQYLHFAPESTWLIMKLPLNSLWNVPRVGRPLHTQVCNGLPTNSGFATESYARRHAPEFASGRPYNPFRLDIWQLGTSLVSQFQVNKFVLHLILVPFIMLFAPYHPKAPKPNN